jgi:hypothetical protein
MAMLTVRQAERSVGNAEDTVKIEGTTNPSDETQSFGRRVMAPIEAAPQV